MDKQLLVAFHIFVRAIEITSPLTLRSRDHRVDVVRLGAPSIEQRRSIIGFPMCRSYQKHDWYHQDGSTATAFAQMHAQTTDHSPKS